MKSCPYCAEQIQDAAIRCRHCGMSLQSREPASLQSFVEDYRLAIALAGSLLLGLGVFVPIVSLPIVGTVNYLQNGKGDGALILVLAAASAVIAIKRRFGGLWWTGGGCLAIVVFAFVYLSYRLNQAKADLAESMSGSMFKGLAEAAAQSVQLQWGWFVLFVGALLLLTAAWGWKAPKPSSAHSLRTMADHHHAASPVEKNVVATVAAESVSETTSSTSFETVLPSDAVATPERIRLPPASHQLAARPSLAPHLAAGTSSKFGACSKCERLVLTGSLACRFCNATGPEWSIRS